MPPSQKCQLCYWQPSQHHWQKQEELSQPIKAKEVIKIGRNLSRAPSIAACKTELHPVVFVLQIQQLKRRFA